MNSYSAANFLNYTLDNFIDLTLYLVISGSFYIIYKINEKMPLILNKIIKVKYSNFESLYYVSLFVDVVVLCLCYYFHPQIIQQELKGQLQNILHNTYWFPCVIVTPVVAYLLVLFEKYLCTLWPLTVLTFAALPSSQSIRNDKTNDDKKLIKAFKISLNLGVVIVVIGIMEELIFRGFLTGICLQVNEIHFKLLLLLNSILAFGLSHLFLGWIQFFSKFLLAVSMLVLYFLSGSIFVPAICHALFNYLILQKIRPVT